MTDDMAVGLAGFAALFLMILLQVPVGIAMALVGVVGTGILIGFEPALALLAIEPSAALASESLAIIAMFLLMGNLAHAGGLSAELYRLADDAVGHRNDTCNLSDRQTTRVAGEDGLTRRIPLEVREKLLFKRHAFWDCFDD